MNPKQRLTNLLNGLPVDRPPFFPAIYDLKPVFISAPFHTFGQSKEEIIRALKYEVEVLQLEGLTVAYDIYNIEAEAIGCKLSCDPAIGMPEIATPFFHTLDEVAELEEFMDIAGRMPLFVSTSETAQKLWGAKLPVRAGVSGPFSMAAKIYPQNKLLMETITNPEGVAQLLKYCTGVIKTYIQALIKTGAGIVVFDSFVSPPMLSPELYRDLVLPFHKELFGVLKDANVLQRTLVVGGNSTSILPDLTETGATQLLLDFSIPIETCREVLNEYKNMVFRVNLPPALFLKQDISELKEYVLKVLKIVGDCPNLILGTGILPPETLPKNISKTKDLIVDYYK